MKLKDVNSVYLIGIGGIGMSALARWFNANGHYVAGYDKTETDLTRALLAEGISIHFDDDVDLIPTKITKDKTDVLVIYTPAIPTDHKELNYLRDENYILKKRSEVLGMITADYKSIAIAGTHGKTTTSSMVAHILKHAKVSCSAFIGGITKNYNSNLLLDETNSKNAVVVMEADEYDRSFLRLSPDISLITTIDADHLDIYADESDFEATFEEFVGKLKEGGSLVYNKNIKKDLGEVKDDINAYTYGLEDGDNYGYNLRVEQGEFVFDYAGVYGKIDELRLQLPGQHNVENAVGAITVAMIMDIDPEVIKSAIASYQGVKRRFDYIVRNEKVVYVDDYAHHPKEIEAFVSAARMMFPGKKLKVVFQPHLFSRTRDFMDDFAIALSKVDSLVLLDIYPAREKPIDGITSEVLLSKVNAPEKYLLGKQEVLDHISDTNYDVLATLGAGDIDKLIEPIKQKIEKRVYA